MDAFPSIPCNVFICSQIPLTVRRFQSLSFHVRNVSKMSGALCLYSCMRGRHKQLFGSSMCFSATWLGSEPAFSFWDPNIIIISVFAKEVPFHFSVEDSPGVLPRSPACTRLPVFWKPRQGRELGLTTLAPCFIPSLSVSLSQESSSQTPAEAGRAVTLENLPPASSRGSYAHPLLFLHPQEHLAPP